MLDGCLPIFKKCAEQTTVKEQKVQGCDAYHSNYIRVNLVVPPLPPTDDSSSNILKISYFIQVRTKIYSIYEFSIYCLTF